MKPRPYQFDAVESFFDYWRRLRGNPVCCLPTGTGKSIVIAEFIRQALAKYPKTRILVLTHVKELVGQNFEKLLEIWPTAPAGIFSAGLRRKDIGAQVTFAGIGSIVKHAAKFGHIDLVFIDEAHTVSVKESTSYRKFIAALTLRNPLLKVGGLTATPYRLGQGMIVEPGGIFSDICFDLTGKEAFNKLVAEGYICPLVPRPLKTEIDISAVHVAKTGDFNLNELQAAVDRDEITRAAVDEMIELGSDREHWLIFAAGIEHAEHVAAILSEKGIPALAIHSKSSNETRDAGVADFKAGKFRALVNNGCFTTGFDFPGIDLIGCLRHTTSPGLWVQMLGRGTRPVWLPGFDLSTNEGRLACIAAFKPNCLVLDFARNAERLGPINDPKKPNPRKKTDTPGDAPAKTCPACWVYNHASARVCSECGEKFTFQIKLKGQSSTDELIAGADAVEPISEWFDVETVTYSKFKPWNGKIAGRFNRVPASLHVSYNCGLRSFSERVNLEHDFQRLAAARHWWTLTSPGLTIPPDVDSALKLCDDLRQPAKIRVWINRKNPQVLHREFLT